MPTSFYDVVVIGDELAGAVAGALLARRGFRVLVLASQPVEREVLGPGSSPAPRAPLALTGLESPALKRVVNELNLLQLLRRRVTPNHPAFQLLLPDHRIDVGDELGRELARELPDEAAAVEAWLGRAGEVSTTLEGLLAQDVTLPPDGFWDRRDLKRIAAQLPPEAADGLGAPAGEAGMLAVLPARFASDLAQPGTIAAMRLADQHRRGTWRLDGGRDALRALLYERIRTYSGEVRHAERVRGIVLKRGRAVAVGVGDRDESVGCAQVIAAMPAAELVELLPEAPPRRLAEVAAATPAWWRYRLHFVAPLDALPDALAPFALSVRDPAAPLTDGNALALHLSTGLGQHASITAEALAKDRSPEALARLRGVVRAHVDALFPFVSAHLVAVGSPHDGLPVEAAAPGPALAAAPLDPVWDLPAPRPLGLCGVPHATGVKQLWLASRQTLPGLGLEGELAAGWVCARLIGSRSKKREIDKAALLAGG